MNCADTVGALLDTVLILDFLFFHPDAPRFYHLTLIGVNHGQNRECVTEA